MAPTNNAQSHDIVIIGAGFGGVSVAHTLLKKTIPSLPRPKSFNVTMIAPNTQFYWNVAAPRYIANPEMLAEARFFLDIAPGLRKYGQQFRQVLAYAISVEPATQLISYGQTVDGLAMGTLHYDTLVIATGSAYAEAMWSSSVHEQTTKQALTEIHAKLAGAKSILVAGGGTSGVETSGELAYRYSETKDITLLSGSSRLLPKLKDPRMGEDAQRRLEKLGVNVVHRTRIRKAGKTPAGSTLLTLDDGSEQIVDVFIDATGQSPSNKFIPSGWLDDSGRVKSNTETLRARIPGVSNVYVIGSVGSYSDGGLFPIMQGCKPVCESIRIDLAGESDSPNRKTVFRYLKNDFQIVAICPGQGVGTVGGWKLPNWLVALYKSRNYNVIFAKWFTTGTMP